MITYTELSPDNFNENSLDNFIRHQEVKECWRCIDGKWAVLPISFTEEWSLQELRELASDILSQIQKDWFAVGAFSEEELVGFATVSKNRFGSRNQYMELVLFYVSEPFRSQGIGRNLFNMAASKAKTEGAEKLYISAHSSKESQAAYHKLGCRSAEEINQALAEKEPCDVQMEYGLQ